MENSNLLTKSYDKMVGEGEEVKYKRKKECPKILSEI